MDKLRALEYFVTSAQEHSFSGAARRLGLSVPAITRLVGMLEQSLGVALFDRTVQGITLTADGARYLEACQPLLQGLTDADDVLRGAVMRPRGTVVVGASPILSQHCIVPSLPDFHARYPDINIDVRNADKAEEAAASEVLVVYGWPKLPDLVHRRLANTRLLICASPAYWATHSIPQRPKDLLQHPCLLYRDQAGTVIDLWEHERNGESEAVAVSGWLVSTHRDVVLDAVIAGAGIARLTDLSIRAPLKQGQLVPVLLDWESKHAPPINLLYRSSQRRLPRVRAFVDFLTDLFARLEAERDPRYAVSVTPEKPHWYRRRHDLASATPRSSN